MVVFGANGTEVELGRSVVVPDVLVVVAGGLLRLVRGLGQLVGQVA